MTKQDIKIINKLSELKFNNLKTELKETITGLVVMINEQKSIPQQNNQKLLSNNLNTIDSKEFTTEGNKDIKSMNKLMESQGNGSKINFLKTILSNNDNEQSLPTIEVENLIDKFIKRD